MRTSIAAPMWPWNSIGNPIGFLTIRADGFCVPVMVRLTGQTLETVRAGLAGAD
jgi:hypothetical protein